MIKEFLDLLDPVQKIKFQKRKGWIERGLYSDTISAHVYDAIMIGLYLAKKENLDENHVIQLLIMHDLVMAYMDDVTPSSGMYDQKVDYEEESAKAVAEHFPEFLRKEYETLWREYQEQKTPLSRIAREADKLATLSQREFYEKVSKKDIQSEFLVYYSKYFSGELVSKTGKELFEELKKVHEARNF